MRFVLLTLSIAGAGWLAHQVLPWYAIVVAAALVAFFFRQGAAPGFAAGFLAGLVLWGGYAFLLNAPNEGLLAGRVGQLFGGLGAAAMIGVTGLLGGLFGGLGALTGSLGGNLPGRGNGK